MTSSFPKSRKINMYKFVSPTKAAAGAEDPGMAKLAGQTIQAINNLGSVVNSIAGLANDLRNIQLANLDQLKKKKIFEALITLNTPEPIVRDGIIDEPSKYDRANALLEWRRTQQDN